jgi:septal ring factor EnvC (AmiA/AmiB activator)
MSELITAIEEKQALDTMIEADNQAGDQTENDLEAKEELLRDTQQKIEDERARSIEDARKIVDTLAIENKQASEDTHWQVTKKP